MKKIFITILILSMTAMSAFSDVEKDHSIGQYIVVFDTMSNAVGLYGVDQVQVITRINSLNAVVIKAPEYALTKIKANLNVKYIEEDYKIQIDGRGNKKPKPDETNPLQVVPWNMTLIGATSVWNETTGNGVSIAVIDTGIDYTHPDLNIVGGISFVRKSSSPNDDNGHGTHVAGIAAGLNNDVGIVGVAPEAELYSVKVLDRRGSGYTSDVIKGIEWATNQGLDIINMSLGSTSFSQAMYDAVTYAEEHGVIVVAASGNDSGAINYPAAYSSVIAVGSVDQNEDLAYYSSYGTGLNVVAPGSSIYSTYKSGGYKTLDGTSMATPHVAGLAALYLEKFPQASVNDFKLALVESSKDLGDIGYDIYYGNGLIDTVKMLGE